MDFWTVTVKGRGDKAEMLHWSSLFRALDSRSEVGVCLRSRLCLGRSR